MSELVVEGVYKSFGQTTVLEGIELCVADGSLTALLGASGSGKTTLLRILAGFDRPDSGIVRIDTEVVVGPGSFVPAERRGVGYVPQEGALFPHLNVTQNIGFGVRDRSRRADRVAELLELVGMEEFGSRRPYELSGGQRQRVALARALAPSPRIVLLDEPFSSLDPKLHDALSEEVVEVLRRTATTSVLVTHDQDEALALADQVAVLRDGHIIQVDAPHELYELPKDPGIAAFVGVANFVEGTARHGVIETALGPLSYDTDHNELSDGEEVVVLLRPEQLRLAEDGGDGRQARVLRNEFHGHDSLLHLELLGEGSGEEPLHLTARTSGEDGLSTGEIVRVSAGGPVIVWPRSQAPAAALKHRIRHALQ